MRNDLICPINQYILKIFLGAPKLKLQCSIVNIHSVNDTYGQFEKRLASSFYESRHPHIKDASIGRQISILLLLDFFPSALINFFEFEYLQEIIHDDGGLWWYFAEGVAMCFWIAVEPLDGEVDGDGQNESDE